MRSTALVLAVAAVSAGDGVRAAYFPRAVAGDGFVTVPVGRRQRTDKMKRDDGSVLMPLANEDAFYAAESECHGSRDMHLQRGGLHR